MTSATPYVGPRALESGEPFYGRSREVAELTNRFLAERIMLLYAPSGAGKTSIINAGLAPRLKTDYGFELHTVVRVHLAPDDATLNRYVYSTIASLEEDEDALGLSVDEMGTMTLQAYLEQRMADTDTPHAIVFDQFEELISASAFDQDKKREFVDQLAIALQERRLYALFSMREEFLGAFDEYRTRLPTRLAAKFRLGLLGHQSALEAISEPAKHATPSRPFTAGAAQAVLKNLVRSEGEGEEYPYAEPLHIQVLCLRIWQQTQAASKIKKGDIRNEDIGDALARYYAKEVSRAARRAVERDAPETRLWTAAAEATRNALGDYQGTSEDTSVRDRRLAEREIRKWVQTKLISAEGDRRLTQSTPQVENADLILNHLLESHLVTTEPRSGKLWYELSHDRLVGAARHDNERWDEANLTLFQKRSAAWYEAGALDEALPRGEEYLSLCVLAEDVVLTDEEQKFLEKSKAKHEQFKRNSRNMKLFAAVVIALLLFAGWQWWSADQDKKRAEASEASARSAELAGEARAVEDPNLALILAVEAAESRSDDVARNALHQASGGRLLKALGAGANEPSFVVAAAVASDATGRLLIQRDGGDLVLVEEPMSDQLVTVPVGGDLSYDRLALGSDTMAGLAGDRLTVVRGGEFTETVLPAPGLDVVISDGEAVVLIEDGSLSVHAANGTVEPVVVEGVPFTAIAVAPDGSLFVGDEFGAIWTIDVDDLDPMRLSRAAFDLEADALQTPVSSLAVDAQTIALGHSAGSVELIDRDTQVSRTVVPLSEPATGLVMTEAGSVVVASRDGAVRVLDPITGVDLFTITLSNGPVVGLAPLPGDGLALATPGVALTIWDVSLGHLPGQALRVITEPAESVISAGSDGRVLRWVLDGERVGSAQSIVEPAESAESVTDLERRTDGLLALATANRISLLQSSGSNVATLEHDATVRAMSFIPNDGGIVAATADGVLTRWSDTGALVAATTNLGLDVLDVVAIDDGAMVLATDGSLWQWDYLPDTEPLAIDFSGVAEQGTSLDAFDGRVLIGTPKGRVVIVEERDVRAGSISEESDTLGPGLAAVTAITASATPTDLVAFSMSDGTTEVWQADTVGDWSLRERIPSRSQILSVDFTPDRTAIVAATADGRVIAYTLDPQRLDEAALEKIGRFPTDRECDRFDLERSWCDS